MKLFTHNLLVCNSKSCKIGNYPLRITPTLVDVLKTEYNDELIKRFIKRVDFNGLMEGVKDMGIQTKYDYRNLKEEEFTDEAVLGELHHLLFECVLVDGILTCPSCGLKYPVNNGIADFVINE